MNCLLLFVDKTILNNFELEIWKDKVMIQKSIKEKGEADSKSNTRPSNKKTKAIKSDSAASYSNAKKRCLSTSGYITDLFGR